MMYEIVLYCAILPVDRGPCRFFAAQGRCAKGGIVLSLKKDDIRGLQDEKGS